MQIFNRQSLFCIRSKSAAEALLPLDEPDWLNWPDWLKVARICLD